MKLSGKKTRHKLQVSDETNLIFLGLVTPEPDYKISLILNNTIQTRFKSSESINIVRDDNIDCSFSRFTSKSEINDLNFELISNRSGACIIDKKLNGLDYLLIVRGHNSSLTKDDLINLIRENGAITGVFDLDKKKSIADNILLQIY
jgi:hypothetical protein